MRGVCTAITAYHDKDDDDHDNVIISILTLIFEVIEVRRAWAAASSALASSNARLLGSTSQYTSKNRIIFITQEHKPENKFYIFNTKNIYRYIVQWG